MIEDSLLPFSFPAVGRKKITAAFDGGRITSDFGVMLLGQAGRRLGVAEVLLHSNRITYCINYIKLTLQLVHPTFQPTIPKRYIGLMAGQPPIGWSEANF